VPDVAVEEAGRDDVISDDVISDDLISDDELAALAMAADPDASVDPDAVSLYELTGEGEGALLPSWYMPAPMGGERIQRRGRPAVILVIIAAFLVINAGGLCSTYGHVGFG